MTWQVNGPIRLTAEEWAKQGMDTLVFGWSWQVWTEDTYPGTYWEYWMKVCTRCYRGHYESHMCSDCLEKVIHSQTRRIAP